MIRGDSWRRAVHESGHVLVVLALGDEFRAISVDITLCEAEDRGGRAVYGAMPDGEIDRLSALKVVLVGLGGWAAESIVFGEDSRNSEDDIRQALEILSQIEEPEAVGPALRQSLDMARSLLQSNLEQLHRLATALLHRGVMNRDEIDEVLGSVEVFEVSLKNDP